MSDVSEFSTENLLTLLDQIKNATIAGELPQESQERVWSSLTWDKNEPDNKEMIKYLFTGWWIHQHLPDASSSADLGKPKASQEPRTSQGAT